MEMDGYAGLVARRRRLHRRIVQGVVKLTFARGASLPDPAGLFNASLDGKVRRAIDFHEGETVDAQAFVALIRAAVVLNVSRKAATAQRAKSAQ